MIHDAKIEITCDGCSTGFTEYEMPWIYSDYTGNDGYYGSNENDIETFLKSEGWFIKNEKHFCCSDCLKGY